MTHSIRFDADDTVPTDDRPVSTFTLRPPAGGEFDPEELEALQRELDEHGLAGEWGEDSEGEETVTVKALLETPVEFEGEQQSFHDVLSAPIPLDDGGSLALLDIYWLHESDPWNPEAGAPQRIDFRDVLDAPLEDLDGLTLRAMYDRPLTMKTVGVEQWLGESGTEPFVGVYEQMEATFEHEGTSHTLEEVAFARLELDGVETPPTPYELHMFTPLGLTRVDSDGEYRLVAPEEVADTTPLTFVELIEEHYGIYDPVALGAGPMAGALLDVAVNLIPVIVFSAKFVRDHWDDIVKVVETIGDFYDRRETPIETTVAVDCPDGRRVSIEYAGDPDEFRTILSELEVACE